MVRHQRRSPGTLIPDEPVVLVNDLPALVEIARSHIRRVEVVEALDQHKVGLVRVKHLSQHRLEHRAVERCGTEHSLKRETRITFNLGKIKAVRPSHAMHRSANRYLAALPDDVERSALPRHRKPIIKVEVFASRYGKG